MRMSMEEDSIDRVSLGLAVLEYTYMALHKALSVLAKLEGKVRVVHVKYSDTVKNAKIACQNICEKV